MLREATTEAELLSLRRELKEQRTNLGATFASDVNLAISLEDLVKIYARKVEIWKETASYFIQEFGDSN